MALAFRKNWKSLIGAPNDLANEVTDLVVREEVETPTVPTQLVVYTFATAPTAADWTGALAYFSDGDAGAGGVAFSNGTDWLNVTTGSGIATS